MELKERLKRGLVHSREVTEGILSEFKKPENWIQRAAPGSNHALWIAGHLASAENFFIGLIDPSKKDDNTKYAKLFGKGSTLSDNLEDYPSPEEILVWMKDRRKVYFQVLDDCSNEDLERKIIDGPPFMYDVAAIFQMSSWHESLHSGQLTVIHRSLGHTPLADRMETYTGK